MDSRLLAKDVRESPNKVMPYRAVDPKDDRPTITPEERYAALALLVVSLGAALGSAVWLGIVLAQILMMGPSPS